MADAWLDVSSWNVYSYCGWDYDYGYSTLENALDGNYYWAHQQQHVHWFILDLGDVYTVKWLRGRSNALTGDPTDVDVYVSDYDSFNWILAASGIWLWQDSTYWVEWNCNDIHGRYIYVEVWETEDYPWNWLYWGGAWPSGPFFPIFDIYGCPYEAPVYLSGGISCSSSVGAAKLNGIAVPTGGETGSETEVTDAVLSGLAIYLDTISYLDFPLAVGIAIAGGELFSFPTFHGKVTGKATATAKLSATMSLTGVVGGEAIITDATLSDIFVYFTGVCTSEITAGCLLSNLMPSLVGSTVATSSTTAALTGIAVNYTGTTGGEVEVTDAALSGLVRPLLTGLAVATSSAEATLGDKTTPLVGLSSAESTAEGLLSGILHKLEGSVAAQSTVSGVVDVWRWVWRDGVWVWVVVEHKYLTSTVTCVSTIAAAHLTKERALTGAITCQSTTNGSLTVVQEFTTTVASISACNGSVKVVRGLTGKVACSSSPGVFWKDSSIIWVDANVIWKDPPVANLIIESRLFSSVAACSTVNGSIEATKKLVSVITAQSSVSGKVTLPGELTGVAITAQSSVSGVTSVIREFTGRRVVTRSSITGQVKVTKSFVYARAVDGRGIVSGLIKVAKKLIGVITTQSSVSGSLWQFKEFTGVVTANSTSNGTLEVVKKLTGSVTSQSTTVGSLRTICKIVGLTITTHSTVSDVYLIKVKWVIGTIGCNSGANGYLDVVKTVKVIVITRSTIFGSIEVAKKLMGGITFQSTVSGALSEYIPCFVFAHAVVLPVFAGTVTNSPVLTVTVDSLPALVYTADFSPVLIQYCTVLPIFVHATHVNAIEKKLVYS